MLRPIHGLLFMVSVAICFACVTPRPVPAQSAPQADVRAEERGLPKGHSPRHALHRALIVPGWGQIYNRQYIKASVYYAGLGAASFLVVNANQKYLTYRHAALYAQYRDVPPEERPDAYRERFVAAYNEARSLAGLPPEDTLNEEDQITARQSLAPTLRNFRNQFRRRRDLNILVTFAVWGLGVLEAYVSAHLIHFDVGEDLTFQVIPHAQGTTALLQVTF